MREARSFQTHRPSASEPPSLLRLAALRERMATLGIDALLVRSTDAYLNEYVSSTDSTREWLTGFSGSMGDALITRDRATLIVDGRYTLQAANEAPHTHVVTSTLGNSIEQTWLALLPALKKHGVRTLGVETERVSQQLWQALADVAAREGITLIATAPSLVQTLRDSLEPRTMAQTTTTRDIWPIDAALSGRTVAARLAIGTTSLDTHKLDGQLVVALDELAWITNLRGAQFPYQATFRAAGLVTRNDVLLACDTHVDGAEREVVFVRGDVGCAIQALATRHARALRIGVDVRAAPAATVTALKDAGVEVVDVASAFAHARTVKTPAELAHMIDAFARADGVVSAVQKWACAAVERGARITEADVAHYTHDAFVDSGATGLSFKVISAASKNGAVIHHSTPDATRALKVGELFLLDTGAYYAGGYATDLTRTFLLGHAKRKADARTRRLFTLVLKAAIAGMSAVLPVGAVGEQLDAIVRRPLWQHSLDYGHGTGHGVGVNVHEAPPRISIGSRVPLELGQVFSIEPGVYLPGWGGVRVENLCTLVPDDDVRDGIDRSTIKNMMRVQPLTFSPLDKRLIDARLLDTHERRFLRWFHTSQAKRTALPPRA